MSTRWYPIYQKGNPQLRVFLPNFWMKLVAPTEKQPKNVVQFHCSMEMTKYDVKNYLEKIYNVPVVYVRTRIKLGKITKMIPGNSYRKDDDVKVAYVVMPKENTFDFPIVAKNEKDDDTEIATADTFRKLDIQKEALKKYGRFNAIPGILHWFKI